VSLYELCSNSEVEECPGRPSAVGFEEVPVEGGLLGIVGHRGQQGIPVRQVAIEP